MTGKPFIDKILILINALLVLGSAGLVFYSHKMIKKVPTDQVGEFQNLKDTTYQNIQVTPVKLKKLTINLFSEQTRLRFLDIEPFALTFEDSQKQTVTDFETQILDIIIDVASGMEPNELNTLTGKMLFESRIKNKINELLGEPIIKQVFFGKFVIQ
jgi:flagellar FliL protein